MKMLALKDVSKSFSRFTLGKTSFTVAAGEYCVLFGPTGSGKTLLFELIAGIGRPDTGRISIAGKDITSTDPARRRIGYVPQDMALIPFKNVWQNVAFGLHSPVFRPRADRGDTWGAGTVSDEIRRRVDEMLDMLKIRQLADRMPAHLSGGEKQRVALGRALVVRPDLLLLDEPLSALDENTGNLLMREIKHLQQKSATTTLHICHRLEEMFFLGDRIAVLKEGRLLQTGAPDEICDNPANEFVAAMVRAEKLNPVEQDGESGLRRQSRQ